METLRIDIAFDSEFKNSPPYIHVLNDARVVHDKIAISGPTHITFQIDLSPGDHMLEIVREGHDDSNYQLCKLSSFQTDDIDVTEISQFAFFYPRYPNPWFQEQQAAGVHWPQSHKAWTEWGWNGTWKLSYSSPFYTWLLNSI